MPPFGPQSFVFLFAVSEYKDSNMHKYSSSRCFGLRLCENRGLRELLGPKMEEVTGG
jgi:hypothetical protein